MQTQTSRMNFATEQKVGFIKFTRAVLPPLLGRHCDIIFCLHEKQYSNK